MSIEMSAENPILGTQRYFWRNEAKWQENVSREPNFRYTTILANALQRLRDVSFNQRQMQRAEAKAKAALTF